MKILHFVPRIPSPPIDGGAIYVYYTAKELAKLGNNVIIAALESNKHKQDIQPLKQFSKVYSVKGNFKKYSLGAAIKSLITQYPVTVQHRIRMKVIKALVNKVEENVDVILIEGIHMALATPLLKKKFPDTPIVLRQSNVEHEVLYTVGKYKDSYLEKLFYKWQGNFMKSFELNQMPKMDAVTVISDYDLNKFKKLLPDLQYFISSAGAYIPEITEQRKKDYLISISNWEWAPNIQGLKWFLDKVWPQIHNANPEITYGIAGKGIPQSMIDSYKHLNIKFLGLVDDIETFRQQGTFFIAPLFSGSGMKLKILEAFASGLPTVTTQIGIQGIKAKAGKDYIHAETKEEFSKGIQVLLNNKTERDKMGSNARNLINQSYHWPVLASELEEFLRSL